MLPLRLLKCSSRLASLNSCSNVSKEFQHIAFVYSRRLPAQLPRATFYCTEVKKNNIAIGTVKSSELLQEALVKKKQQLQEKKQQFQENFHERTQQLHENLQEKKQHFKDNFHERTQQLHENLQEKKQQLQENIRDTKSKMREKVGEVIERENIFTVPNGLCIGRIIMSPYLGYVIIQGDFSLAMGLMVAAGLTDLADGYIARNWPGQMSNFGSFLDPLADKCLMGTLVGALAYCNLMPLWLAVVILFRDVFLIAAAFVIRYKSLPSTHRTLTRYFDASHATAQLEPTITSKVNTAVQLFTVAATLGAPVWDYIDHPALHGLWYLTGATTLAAAISYMVKKDTYKYLRREMKKK